MNSLSDKRIDVACLGELMIDMSMEAYSDGAAGFKMYPGGAAANVAVGVARMGMRPAIVCKISRDYFGDYLQGVCEENGVETAAILRDDSRKVTLAFVTMDEARKPAYMFYRENTASSTLCPKELNQQVLRESKVLYFSSMGLIRQPFRDANYEAVRLVEEGGGLIAFDPNVRLHLWRDEQEAREEIFRMMPHADILKVNDEELAFLFGKREVNREALESVWKRYPRLKLVAVTQGEKGVSLLSQSGAFAQIPALDTRVVDTMGAGDSFFAALLCEYLRLNRDMPDGADLTRMGRYANAAALLTAQKKGAIPALPMLEQVQRKADEYEGKR